MQVDEIYTRLNSIFLDLFDEDVALTPTTTADDVAGWDSLSHVRLILTVQQKFGVKFSAAQTTAMKNVGELVSLIQAKVG